VDSNVSYILRSGWHRAKSETGRLYKKNYSSFEEYCQTRWGWTRKTAYKYIDIAAYADDPLVTPELQNLTKTQALREARGMDVHYSSESRVTQTLKECPFLQRYGPYNRRSTLRKAFAPPQTVLTPLGCGRLATQ